MGGGGAVFCLALASAQIYLEEPAERGAMPEQLLLSSRQVIRFQVWGQEHPLCHRLVPAALGLPPVTLCSGALSLPEILNWGP